MTRSSVDLAQHSVGVGQACTSDMSRIAQRIVLRGPSDTSTSPGALLSTAVCVLWLATPDALVCRTAMRTAQILARGTYC